MYELDKKIKNTHILLIKHTKKHIIVDMSLNSLWLMKGMMKKHIAEQMKDEYTTCVALLHDVVEDTDVTIEALEKEFPKEVTEAVRIMTHNNNESYENYVRKIKDNDIAKTVKLGDLAHNMDETRLAGNEKVSNEQIEKWRKKYKMTLEILSD